LHFLLAAPDSAAQIRVAPLRLGQAGTGVGSAENVLTRPHAYEEAFSERRATRLSHFGVSQESARLECLSSVRLLLFAFLIASCARPPVEPMHDERAELVTIAAVGSEKSIWHVLGEPIGRGRRYAVVDDRGYVGTLRAESEVRCIIACEDCCPKPQWTTTWFEPPLRDRPEGLVLAIGPVDGRYVSVRRELPVSVDPEGNPWEWTFVRSDDFRTLARFSFGSGPALLEARGRLVDDARVIELRVRHHGAWRVVSRTVEKSDPRRALD
jgi:hypothetical protein